MSFRDKWIKCGASRNAILFSDKKKYTIKPQKDPEKP